MSEMSQNSNVPSVDGRDPAYFSYYAMLQHQQNMLQDSVRTSTYRSAILLNGDACFKDKVVMDVGAGSGILSYFSVQAGAKKVYAVEASSMAIKMRKLVDAAVTQGKNTFLQNKIEVINAKVETPNIPIPMVDTIISEPIGVLLVHERMLESFIYARDHYLKPDGTIFPSKGTIFLAPFTDAALWTETMGKARFWEQQSFYGIDLSPLCKDARDEIFGMPVVGHFDARSILAQPHISQGFSVDFTSITIPELQDFTINFEWMSNYTGIVHGIAGWFDLYFDPPPHIPIRGSHVEMSTSPAAERTHWQQVRFLFKEPLAVNSGQTIRGWMRCVVNDMRSYTVAIEITAGEALALTDPSTVSPSTFSSEADHILKRRGKWELHEQTYNYNYNPAYTTDYKPEYSCLYEPEQPNSASLPATIDATMVNFDAVEFVD